MSHLAQVVLVVAVLRGVVSADAQTPNLLELRLQSQVLRQDQQGRNIWETVTTQGAIEPQETAIIVCDMWDKHWSRGATERVAAMAPRMNEVLRAARAKGVTIVHCPSETLDFYKDSRARQRMIAAPQATMPAAAPRDNPPQPVDASDGGSDTGEKPWHRAWTRQHPAIEIDEARDGISDSGQEVWNFFQQKGIKNVIVMGVHTNMCVLNRPFAVRAMVGRGMTTMLVRDLTDAMYNPAKPPYVSHEEGTRLVIEYIEKFWCPTIESSQLVK